MKNLESLQLTELDAREVREVEGGIVCGGLCLAIVAGVVAGLVVSAIDNFGDLREGLIDGYNGTPRY